MIDLLIVSVVLIVVCLQIKFVVDTRECDQVLNRLTAFGLGRIAGTSVRWGPYLAYSRMMNCLCGFTMFRREAIFNLRERHVGQLAF